MSAIPVHSTPTPGGTRISTTPITVATRTDIASVAKTASRKSSSVPPIRVSAVSLRAGARLPERPVPPQIDTTRSRPRRVSRRPVAATGRLCGIWSDGDVPGPGAGRSRSRAASSALVLAAQARSGRRSSSGAVRASRAKCPQSRSTMPGRAARDGGRCGGTAFVGSVAPIVHPAPPERRDSLFRGLNPEGRSTVPGGSARPVFRTESPRRTASGAGLRDFPDESERPAHRAGASGTPVTPVGSPAARIAAPPSPAACRRQVRQLRGRVAGRPATESVLAAPRQVPRPAGISPGEPDSSHPQARSGDPDAVRDAAAPQTAAGTARGPCGPARFPPAGGRTPLQPGGRRRPASDYGQVQREGVVWHVGPGGPVSGCRACAEQIRGVF